MPFKNVFIAVVIATGPRTSGATSMPTSMLEGRGQERDHQ
jgi:hypothetical protein